MKFPTPISTYFPHWACRDDAQDSPVPSCLLSRPCSTHHTISPKSADPSNASAASETPPVDAVTSSLSASSPAYLHLLTADTPHACGHGLCLPHPSVSARSRCCIPVLICRDTASGYLLSAPHSGISSPTLCGMSDSSPYVNRFDNLSCRKGSIFRLRHPKTPNYFRN